MKVIIDNGHGINTPGKCSPDKSILEWKYCREIAKRLAEKLNADKIKAIILVPEDRDISLTERCRRANKIYEQDKDTILVSIHLNAAGNGSKWMNATGWSGWVYTKASNKSKLLAQLLYKQAEHFNLQGNRCVPKNKYWEANFAILKNSKCPAVLTENLFQDNKEDVAYLLTEEGKQVLVDLHYNAIKEYITQM